jgi:hypothetical protein
MATTTATTATGATDTVPAARTSRAESATETSPARTRRSRMNSDKESSGNARYFLSKDGTDGSPALDREVTSEGEVLVEALRLGVTYYEVQEFRVVPDFAGRKPQLNKEAVNGK